MITYSLTRLSRGDKPSSSLIQILRGFPEDEWITMSANYSPVAKVT